MKKTLAGSKIPAYVKVYNSLYSDLKSGVYQENQALPGEVALAEKYQVSRNTLRQALAILTEDGLIIRSQGRETLVAPAAQTAVLNKHRNPLLSLARRAVDHIQIQYNYGAPTDIARTKLALQRGDIVLACDTVYHSGSAVAGYSFTQIPAASFNELGVDISDEEAIEQLATRLIFDRAEQWDLTVKLIYANEIEAPFLRTEAGRPLILMEALLLGQNGAPFARSKMYFLPEHYLLQFRI